MLNEKSDRILKAAAKLFAQHSYAKVSMEQIAATLNLAPGTLYLYFKDKESLIYHSYLRGLDIYADEMAKASEPGLDGLEIIRRFIRGHLGETSPQMILFTDIDALSTRKRQTIHQTRRKTVDMLAQIITRGVRDGSVQSDNSVLSAIAIISILDSVPLWFSRQAHYTHDQAIRSLDDIIAHGIYKRDRPCPAIPPAPDLTAFFQTREHYGKRAAKLDHILRTASDIFNRKGAMGASLDNIAAEAGLTRAGIYYHFRDKEALLYRCVQRGLDMEVAVSRHLIAQGVQGAAAFEIQNMRSIFALHSSLCGPKNTYHNVNYLTAEHQATFWATVAQTTEKGRQQYRHWVNEGFFRDVDIYFSERIKIALSNWYAVWFRENMEWSSTEIADHFSAFYLFGLKPRPSIK